MRLAARYRMTYEYKLARRHGLTPQEALEDWDMMKKEDIKNKYIQPNIEQCVGDLSP